MRLAINESLVAHGKLVPAEPEGGERSGVGVGDRLEMMDDAEPVGGEGSGISVVRQAHEDGRRGDGGWRDI